MPLIRRNSSTPSAPPSNPTNSRSRETTAPESGWVSGRASDQARSAVTGSTPRLTPSVAGISPAPLLKALGDGTAIVEVPLRAGRYDVKGVPFTVVPGTVAHVHVQVKNGELVPVGEGRVGTGVKIEPPLDLPLWITGNGVELVGDEAKQKFAIELGGMFDVRFKARKLSDLLAGSGTNSKPDASPSGLTGALAALATQLIDFSKVSVDAKVTLRDATLDLGPAQVRVDEGTMVQLKGDAQHATLTSRVSLEGFAVDHPGVKLDSSSGGSATLQATLNKSDEGYAVDSTLKVERLAIDRLQASQHSKLDPSQPDRLSLGPAELHDGEIRLATKLTGDGKPVPDSTSVAIQVKGSGTISDGHLTVRDSKDTASLAVAGHFDGAISVKPEGLEVEASVAGAHVEVRDLQQSLGDNKVSVDHLTADGDVKISTTGGRLSVEGVASNLDLLVDDFQGGAAGVKADLGRTQVKGQAAFKVGTAGVDVQGRIRAEAAIDSASFGADAGQSSLGASSVSGTLTKLHLGADAPQLRVEQVEAKLGVERASVAVGAANVSGGGTLTGKGTLVLDAKGFALEGKSQVSLALTEGKLHTSTVDLALAPGSEAALVINELRLGKTSTVKIGAGTRLEAVVASGTMNVAGTPVTLAKGGKAELEVKRAGFENGKPSLRGTLKLDAGVHGNTSLFDGAGLKVERQALGGRVKVSLDDVNLNGDRLTLDGQVSLDAKIGKFVGAKPTGKPGLGTLADPVPVIPSAHVERSTAAELAGLKPPREASPVEALRLLRDGAMRVDVPLSGALSALGIDVVKFPSGSRLGLELQVKDGKVVVGASKAAVSGGVKAVGVEIVGAKLDESGRVRAELKVAGKQITIPIPGFKVPLTMDAMTALITKPRAASSSGSGGALDVLDLAHAQIDVTNATFAKGRLSIPGGTELELDDGAKLSFHGSPLAGELSGTVPLTSMLLARPEIAILGGAGKGQLRASWRREGNKLLVEGGVAQLSIDAKTVVRKGSRTGDYVSLGAGKISGASFIIDSDFELDAKGLVKLDSGNWNKTHFAVTSFVGQLNGLRQTTEKMGQYELGPSSLDGAIGYTTDEGITLKAKVADVDAKISGAKFASAGRQVEIEAARLSGQKGLLVLEPDSFVLDVPRLSWDGVVRKVIANAGPVKAGSEKLSVKGNGRLRYDSRGEVALEGALQVSGRGAAEVRLDRQQGVVVR